MKKKVQILLPRTEKFLTWPVLAKISIDCWIKLTKLIIATRSSHLSKGLTTNTRGFNCCYCFKKRGSFGKVFSRFSSRIGNWDLYSDCWSNWHQIGVTKLDKDAIYQRFVKLSQEIARILCKNFFFCLPEFAKLLNLSGQFVIQVTSLRLLKIFWSSFEVIWDRV